MVGQTLTIPQLNANGTITSTTRVITNIPDATHVTLATAVATTAGQKVAGGAVVNLVCGTANPTPYAEWPDPASAQRRCRSCSRAATARGGLALRRPAARRHGDADRRRERSTDDDADGRGDLAEPARLPDERRSRRTCASAARRRCTLKMAFSKPKANLSAALISYPARDRADDPDPRLADPENRNSDYVSDPISPGTFYTMHFDMQAKDAIVPAGRRLALMVFSSDRSTRSARPPARS